MIPATIEKEIVIDAPIDVVWRVITEPDQIQQWFSVEAELDRRVGGTGRLRFESGESAYLQVETFEPPERFAYRWLHEEGTRARPGNSTLVEFILTADGPRTRVRVVESGFDQLAGSDEAKAKIVEEHTEGWHVITEQLREHGSGVT
jgi:uncharacterized protein YndB with AHSA1/START domain